MELTQLRYFLQVYHLKNICNASARLNVTQQAVSKQIRKLEDELGVALFLRNPRGVEATAYADMLAKEVLGFLPGLDALVSDIQRRDTEITGVVRLGVQCWQMGMAHGLKYDVLKAFGVVLGDSALHHFPALRHMLGNLPGGVEITG